MQSKPSTIVFTLAPSFPVAEISLKLTTPETGKLNLPISRTKEPFPFVF